MKSQSKLRKALSTNKSITLLAILVVVIIFFYFMNPGYLGRSNILILMKGMSLTGIIGVGVGCLLISGGIDLGTGAVAGLSGIVTAFMLQFGLSWPLSVLIGIFFGIFAGSINALLVNSLDMMPFIATIGMASIWQGLSLVLSRANPVKFSNQAFIDLGQMSFLGGYLPLTFLLMIIVMIIYGFILQRTKFGRKVYMCGGNRNAARLAGINVKRISSLMLINCSMLSAFGGVVYAANMRKGDSAALTAGMDAITAAILGGISFMGGAGGIGGLLSGLLLLNFFSNGLAVVQIPSYWQLFAQGALLVIALAVDYYRNISRQKALKAEKRMLLQQ